MKEPKNPAEMLILKGSRELDTNCRAFLSKTRKTLSTRAKNGCAKKATNNPITQAYKKPNTKSSIMLFENNLYFIYLLGNILLKIAPTIKVDKRNKNPLTKSV